MKFWALFLVAACSAFAQTVPPQLFGLHASTGVTEGAPWPSVGMGAVRLLSTNTNWAQLNPSSGVYDWTKLDLWLAAAPAHGLSPDDLLYTFVATPTWASSKPGDLSCAYGPGECDPPNDLNADGTGTNQHFKDFVTALVNHVGGRIRYWEVWNEPWYARQFSGTPAQLVRLAKDLRSIALAQDPTAKILSPPGSSYHVSLTNPCWAPQQMATFFDAGGGPYIDIVSFHAYYAPPGNPDIAEHLLPYVTCIQDMMAAHGQQHKPLWSSEGSWGSSADLGDPDLQAAYVARSYLLLWSKGVSRAFWFRWDNARFGTLWSAADGLNKAGMAYDQVRKWMVDARLNNPCQVDNTSTWTCDFTTASGNSALVVWNSATTTSYTAGTQYVNYQDLYGSSHMVPAGGTVAIGSLPIMLLGSPSSSTPPTATLKVAPLSGTAPFTVTADGSDSHDRNGNPVAKCSINFGDGTTLGSLTASHIYSTAGNFVVSLTVWDSNNLSASAKATVSVSSANNQPPVAVLAVSPESGSAPLRVTASTAGSSDPDGSIISSVIDFGDGTVVNGTTASHTYTRAGNFAVVATVTDNRRASSEASDTVSVSPPNEPPKAVLSVSPQFGVVPLRVTASTKRSTDPDGRIVSSVIDFGDGTVARGTTVSHIYTKTGKFTITATEENRRGASARATAAAWVSKNP